MLEVAQASDRWGRLLYFAAVPGFRFQEAWQVRGGPPQVNWPPPDQPLREDDLHPYKMDVPPLSGEDAVLGKLAIRCLPWQLYALI
jgi:hypothetical protein